MTTLFSVFEFFLLFDRGLFVLLTCTVLLNDSVRIAKSLEFLDRFLSWETVID